MVDYSANTLMYLKDHNVINLFQDDVLLQKAHQDLDLKKKQLKSLITKKVKDHILKKAQCRYLFNLPCYRDMEKWFFDDNEANLEALADLGAIVSNARQWNKIAQRGLENALEGK